MFWVCQSLITSNLITCLFLQGYNYCYSLPFCSICSDFPNASNKSKKKYTGTKQRFLVNPIN